MEGQSTAILDLLFDTDDGILVKEDMPEIQTLDFVSYDIHLQRYSYFNSSPRS